MADSVRLTVMANQAEADVVCSLLRAHGIACADRPADIAAGSELGGGFGWWTEILVPEDALDAARELLASEGWET
jgi:hypothetical protein